MSEYLMFWLSHALVQFGIAVGLLLFGALIGALILIALWIPTWRRQSRCTHDRMYETQSCDAICQQCGKNLGFIGTWRKQQQCKQP